MWKTSLGQTARNEILDVLTRICYKKLQRKRARARADLCSTWEALTLDRYWSINYIFVWKNVPITILAHSLQSCSSSMTFKGTADHQIIEPVCCFSFAFWLCISPHIGQIFKYCCITESVTLPERTHTHGARVQRKGTAELVRVCKMITLICAPNTASLNSLSQYN